MDFIDYAHRKIPDYYDTMYLDGYTPQQIYQAHRKRMLDKVNDEKESPTVEIVSEINQK